MGRWFSNRAIEGRQIGLAQARSNPIPMTFLASPGGRANHVDGYGNASETNRTRDAWRMEALPDSRQRVGTDLADKRGRSRREDRSICEEIRIPSAVLWKGNGRDIRQMAAAASWHPTRRKRTAAIAATAPRAFYEETKEQEIFGPDRPKGHSRTTSAV